MGDRRLMMLGAATGAAFAVLELLAGFIYPQQPRVDGPPAATLAWAATHKSALQTGMIFGLLAAGLLVWFAGYLYSQTRPAQRGQATVGPMILGGGVAAAVVVSLAAVPLALLAFMVGQTPGIPDPTVVRLLGDLNTVLFAASATMTGMFLTAIGVAILRSELSAPRRLGWLSLLAAAFNGVTVWEVITFTTYHGKWWNIVAFGAYIGFVVVMASLSVTMLRRRSDDPAVVMAGT
jgi:MFS family permease